MKKTSLIFSALLITAMMFTSCGDSNNHASSGNSGSNQPNQKSQNIILPDEIEVSFEIRDVRGYIASPENLTFKKEGNVFKHEGEGHHTIGNIDYFTSSTVKFDNNTNPSKIVKLSYVQNNKSDHEATTRTIEFELSDIAVNFRTNPVGRMFTGLTASGMEACDYIDKIGNHDFNCNDNSRLRLALTFE